MVCWKHTANTGASDRYKKDDVAAMAAMTRGREMRLHIDIAQLHLDVPGASMGT